MKKLLLAASAAALVATTPAVAAPTDSDDFIINATVENACTMQNINDINLGNIAVNLTAGASALLINSNTSANSNSFWLSCNDDNTLTIDADAVMTGSRGLLPGDDAGFKNTINYRVTANNYLNSGPQPGFASVGGLTPTASRGAAHRTVTMQAQVLATDNTDARPVSGNYTATVEVTVSTI